jgi:UDP-N-acetylglucosamine 2-epimerase (non-hydrolysing)
MIGIFYGTRPEYIKMLPIIDQLRKREVPFVLYQVQQHTDLIDDCPYDIRLKVNQKTSNRLNDIFASILEQDGDIKSLSHALVQGDTTTATAVALTAFNLGVKVLHVEAGLRTHSKTDPYPEEVNRRVISSLASVHFCPTEKDKENLEHERFFEDEILVTGNTVIDNLVGREATKTNKVLVTMHRRENHDKLRQWFHTIEGLAKKYTNFEFIFPMHPNPSITKHKGIFESVRVIDPLPHDELLDLLSSCAAVITDSGGIIEESSFFNKRCYVCRKHSERWFDNMLLCPNSAELEYMFDYCKDFVQEAKTPFGDGHAGEKIAEDIQRRV